MRLDFETKMKLAQTTLSKLKACNHSAQRWSAATTLGQRRNDFSTLKGLHQNGGQAAATPLGLGKYDDDFSRVVAARQPWADRFESLWDSATATARNKNYLSNN